MTQMHALKIWILKTLIVLVLLLGVLGTQVSSYKILVIAPFPVTSHWLFLQHFLKELLSRGHELTTITNFQLKSPHSNYTEILIDPPYDMEANFPQSAIFDMKYGSTWNNLNLYIDVGLVTTAHALADKKVKNLIERTDLSFDLILSEQFYQEAFLLFAHKYNAPIITLGTIGFSDFMDRAFGLMTPWSFVPHFTLSWNDDLTYSERVYNTILSLTDASLRYFKYYPKMNELARQHFGELKSEKGSLPTVSEMENRISVMLINSHLVTSRPRPSMPGLVSIAGAHVKSPNPLPLDIQTFLDNSHEGVVYFSLGAHINATEMPKDKLNIFINAFKNINQKVLWKYEDESLTNLPSNVMIRKWLPQSDILAHKNIVLFVTHGGMFGTQEGIHRGVPMLFIPFYGDQHRNAVKSTNAGYALMNSFSEITQAGFERNLIEMLRNPSYYRRAKEVSVLFRDNPIHPLDEAMYWIEYVIRHKGAPHMKSSAVNLPWFSYLLLDVYVPVFITIAVVTFGLWKLMKKVFAKKSDDGQKSKRD